MKHHGLRLVHAALCALLIAGITHLARGSTAAPDKLRVVATIPDLADIVRAIGAERVDVTTIAKGRENLHQVAIKPSHIVAMNRADVFVQVGLSLEASFVPGLLEGARNARIQPGKPGFVSASEGWQALDVPANVSRKGGDVHPHGNPHMNLDPRGGRHMAERVLAGLVRVDPGSQALYQRNHDAYAARLSAAEHRWEALGKSWAGRGVVVYHKEYDYLAARYGLTLLGAIEPKPGIPPTPNSIAELVDKLQRAERATILTAVWSNTQVVTEIAARTGAQVVLLPNMCGGLPGTDTWIEMMDVVHARLERAFAAQEQR